MATALQEPPPLERTSAGGTMLYSGMLAAALLALLGALTTIAGPDQQLPRVPAMAFAAASALAGMLGWRRFDVLGRADTVLVLTFDAWLLAFGAW